MQSGKKINDVHENPLDLLLINLCEKQNPVLRRWDVTPNQITTASLVVTGIGLALHRFAGCTTVGALLYFLGYYFDCADGNYARKYNMTTRFGDYYDHFSDAIKMAFVIVVLIYIPVAKRHVRTKTIVLGMIVVLSMLSIVHLGCQERVRIMRGRSNDSDTLGILKPFCVKERWIHVTRYFGTGTLQLGITLALIFLPKLAG